MSKGKERRNSPKSDEEDQMVSAIVNSCLRVITEDTEYSSNPISAQYTPRSVTEASQCDPPLHLNPNLQCNPPLHYITPIGPMVVPEGYYYYVKSGRNRRAISSEESNAFIIDVNKI